jgi:hypothetical protein
MISVCGQELPLDANLDYAAWRNSPIPRTSELPDGMRLQERSQFTYDAANRESIRTTRLYENWIKPTRDDREAFALRRVQCNASGIQKMVDEPEPPTHTCSALIR